VEAGTLVNELKRRRVFRALVVYGVVAFAVLQIIEPVMHGLHWPDAVLSGVVIGLAIAGPVVVAIAWIFDVNDAGSRSRPGLVLVGLSVVVAGGFLAFSLRKVRAALGSIQFKGLPVEAVIHVDGESHASDKPVYLREGTHEFEILAPGYESRPGVVWMTKNLALVFDISLKPLPGRLSVSSEEPVTCTVAPLGGPARTEKVGPDTPLKIDRPAGTMHVKCVKPGAAAFERTVKIEPGRSEYIEVTFASK